MSSSLPDWLAVALAVVAAVALALAAPAALRRVPEPDEPDDDKVAYVDLAARRWLRPVLAVVAGATALVVGVRTDDRPEVLAVWAYLAAVGWLLAYVDWHTRLLPKRLVAPSYAVVGALLLVAWAVTGDTTAAVRAVVAWIAVFVVLGLLWLIYPRGLGYGDVRLSGVLAMALGWLGWAEVVVGMYAAFVIGAVCGVLLTVTRVFDRSGYAFGPFLVVGTFVGAAYGPAIAAAF